MLLDAFRRHASNRLRYLRLQEIFGLLGHAGTYKLPSHELKQARAEELKNQWSLLCRPPRTEITQETDLVREVIGSAPNNEISELDTGRAMMVNVNPNEKNLMDKRDEGSEDNSEKGDNGGVGLAARLER